MTERPTYGLFGKLPAKRDFLALGLAQGALTLWESWLQREIAQSRQLLESAFVPAYLRAPIWRFWCGAGVLGRAASGILMPSVDGVGRYFPLTLIALAPEGRDFTDPFAPEAAERFAALEDLALSALDPQLDYPGFVESLRALSVPETAEITENAADIFVSAFQPEENDLAALLARESERLRTFEVMRARASASRWWTAGGEAFAPRLLGVSGLPAGATFAAMLSGSFAVQEGAT